MLAELDFKHILYATDLGRHTRPVFRQAVRLAQKFNANIIMLHVVEPLGRTGASILSVYLPDSDLERVEHEGMRKTVEQMRQRLERFCEEEMEAHNLDSLHVSDIVVTSGRVDEQILKQAEKHQADLILLGSCYRRQGLHGDSTHRLTQHAKVPVLIVPNCSD
ncbi:universal stress protein [Magnetovirga frankeli]|uniref:universal stress protein n=1 Tax=Magnetovirga frankeli TaxID=947516 RepID=UPI001AF4E151|nr:universal stress protein [gamma proteobacterium SS-5]